MPEQSIEPQYAPHNTTVMLLAAGHGRRMRPLTNSTPKPLLKIAGKSLIEHHLERLSRAGFVNIVINHAYLGEQIVAKLGDGKQYGLAIQYSDESACGALETAGGIINALPLIESDPFMVVNADIFTDFPFADLLSSLNNLGRLVLVPNPPQHPNGDFSVDSANKLALAQETHANFTFSGIALYQKSLFSELANAAGHTTKAQPLAPVLKNAIPQQQLDAIVYDGDWHDIGTPDRLSHINELVK